jgi:hypothetical protein
VSRLIIIAFELRCYHNALLHCVASSLFHTDLYFKILLTQVDLQ